MSNLCSLFAVGLQTLPGGRVIAGAAAVVASVNSSMDYSDVLFCAIATLLWVALVCQDWGPQEARNIKKMVDPDFP